MAATSSAVALARVMARHERANRSSSKRPMVTFVLPMSAASSFTGRILAADLRRSGTPEAGARLADDPLP